MTTTLGQLMVDEALPEDLRSSRHDLDKKSIHTLMNRLAERHPERYRETLKHLSDIGLEAGWGSGASVSLAHLGPSRAKSQYLSPVRTRIQQILNDSKLDDRTRNQQIIEAVLPHSEGLTRAVLEEARQEKSPFHTQVASGGRGKAGDLNSLKGADLLATDAKNQLIPIPVLNNYSEGLTPAEWFASTFAQRRGAAEVKLATADAGFFGKKVANAAHRQVVTRERPDETRLPVGLPVSAQDPDNIGSVLAAPAGPYRAGEIITPQVQQALKDQGVEDILLHSPLTELTPDGGLSRWAAGKRDRHGLARIGDNIGITSAQTVSEKLSQGALHGKHASLLGNRRAARAGQQYLNRLLDGSENFPEAGPLAHLDGRVEEVRKAPQGGWEIRIGDQTHYVHEGVEPTVKPGDQVEAGDDLTDGVPHPRDLVKYRGLGEARRVYTQVLGDALRESGVPVGRRTIESNVAGLLNWARVTDPDGLGDAVVDDIVPANRLIHQYQARPDAKLSSPQLALGQYLEEPVLHYTPGTRVTRKVAKELEKWKIKDVKVHHEAPGFEPHMERSVLSTYHDPDWQVRIQGFYTSDAFLDSLHRGGESDANSTSFIPALARGVGFGENLETHGTYGSSKPLAPARPPGPVLAPTISRPAPRPAPMDPAPMDPVHDTSPLNPPKA